MWVDRLKNGYVVSGYQTMDDPWKNENVWMFPYDYN
jgi:hypothetical protein